MKKIFGIIILIGLVIFAFLSSKNISRSEDSENYMKLRAGTFIKIMTRDELSTLTSDIGDEVTFICTQDYYVYETNAVPENTIFYGEVEDVKEPVDGRNGAIKIGVYKMITPDKKVYRLNAHLHSQNGEYIGGDVTPSVYYHRVPHYIEGMRPMLQVAPLNVLERGRHTVILPGAELFLVFDKDVILK